MKKYIKVMKALSDPNRVKILKMLQYRELCVCEIQAGLDLAQPTVSKHLKHLENAGLVTWSKDAQWVNYRLENAELSPFAARALENLADWLEDDPAVRVLLGRLPFLRREEICRG